MTPAPLLRRALHGLARPGTDRRALPRALMPTPSPHRSCLSSCLTAPQALFPLPAHIHGAPHSLPSRWAPVLPSRQGRHRPPLRCSAPPALHSPLLSPGATPHGFSPSTHRSLGTFILLAARLLHQNGDSTRTGLSVHCCTPAHRHLEVRVQ